MVSNGVSVSLYQIMAVDWRKSIKKIGMTPSRCTSYAHRSHANARHGTQHKSHTHSEAMVVKLVVAYVWGNNPMRTCVFSAHIRIAQLAPTLIHISAVRPQSAKQSNAIHHEIASHANSKFFNTILIKASKCFVHA